MKMIVLMVSKWTNWYRMQKYKFKTAFSKETPWCEHCKESDCVIDDEDTCAMVRVYLKVKNSKG